MSGIIAFEPRRFETAAQYYLEGRPAYSDLLIRRVADFLGFNRSQRVLDLGTGPGQLAVAFAPSVSEVTAIDPEPEMLRIAGEQADKAGIRLTLVEGSSYTLNDTLGKFDLVSIGRAFHWMDRPRTLESLDQLLLPGGSVGLFGTRHIEVPENKWLKDYDELVDSHGEANSHRLTRRSENWLPNETILLNSPFSQLERIGVIERRSTPVAQFVTRALSLSVSSPGRIGSRADDLARALQAALAPYAVDGRITEIVESNVLLAFRPRH